MNGLLRPFIRTLEATGRAERFLSSMAVQGRKRAQENPFVRYTPGPQDVIVMTFPKSGTNWMLQIAHQLIHHGKGEYDHIHDVDPVARRRDDARLHEPLRHPAGRGDGLAVSTRTQARDQDALQLGFDPVFARREIHRRHSRSEGRVRLELLLRQRRRLRRRRCRRWRRGTGCFCRRIS